MYPPSSAHIDEADTPPVSRNESPTHEVAELEFATRHHARTDSATTEELAVIVTGTDTAGALVDLLFALRSLDFQAVASHAPVVGLNALHIRELAGPLVHFVEAFRTAPELPGILAWLGTTLEEVDKLRPATQAKFRRMVADQLLRDFYAHVPHADKSVSVHAGFRGRSGPVKLRANSRLSGCELKEFLEREFQLAKVPSPGFFALRWSLQLEPAELELVARHYAIPRPRGAAGASPQLQAWTATVSEPQNSPPPFDPAASYVPLVRQSVVQSESQTVPPTPCNSPRSVTAASHTPGS